MTDTLTTKLGSTRAGARTRVWIEGKRLNASSFHVGRHFLKQWDAGQLTLTLCDVGEFNNEPRTTRGTVSGKAGRPVIDVTGMLVANAFTGTHVLVTFKDERIIITNA